MPQGMPFPSSHSPAPIKPLIISFSPHSLLETPNAKLAHPAVNNASGFPSPPPSQLLPSFAKHSLATLLKTSLTISSCIACRSRVGILWYPQSSMRRSAWYGP